MKHLGTLNICGLDFEVIEASEKEEPRLEGNYGACVGVEQKIYICEGLKPKKFRWTLIHEMLHGLLEKSGVTNLLMAQMKDKRDYDEMEETVIRILTPHLITTLESMGKLKVK